VGFDALACGLLSAKPKRPSPLSPPSSKKDIAMPNAPNELIQAGTATPVGAVMVVGGGIAGMQASLDLAASGYYVHLVEQSSAIGGLMSQLDKTFPTNDCAM
jgi:NADPH-dependent 2,4-dienoyl-CoA reductase/sulfur reductase-like enzyme